MSVREKLSWNILVMDREREEMLLSWGLKDNTIFFHLRPSIVLGTLYTSNIWHVYCVTVTNFCVLSVFSCAFIFRSFLFLNSDVWNYSWDISIVACMRYLCCHKWTNGGCAVRSVLRFSTTNSTWQTWHKVKFFMGCLEAKGSQRIIYCTSVNKVTCVTCICSFIYLPMLHKCGLQFNNQKHSQLMYAEDGG